MEPCHTKGLNIESTIRIASGNVYSLVYYCPQIPKMVALNKNSRPQAILKILYEDIIPTFTDICKQKDSIKKA